MDAQILTTSDGAGIVTGLNHLEGQNAYVFVNDFPIGNFYIPVGGQIDVKTANANVRVGLDYKPSIIPMPTVAFLQNGLSVYEPTKIEYMYVDFFESLGIVADGKPLPETSPGAFMANQIPEPQTSYYKIPTYNGWDARVEIEITQSYPAPMNLLAVSYTVEVSP
jgi:hypothetical protein